MESLLLRFATGVLPESHRGRFRAEWSAELVVVREQRGAVAAYVFVLELVRAATKITRHVRSDSKSAYAELSAASLSAMPPTLVLATWALLDGRWSMVVAQLVIGIGILLVAAGFWSRDGRLLDSVKARVGLVLIVLGGVVGAVVIRFDDFSPLADQRIDVAFPTTAILVGLGLLAASNYSGRFRPRVQLLSMYVLAPASIVLVCVAVYNAMHVEGLSRLVVLVYAVPAIVLTWACYSIAGRPREFAEEPGY